MLFIRYGGEQAKCRRLTARGKQHGELVPHCHWERSTGALPGEKAHERCSKVKQDDICPRSLLSADGAEFEELVIKGAIQRLPYAYGKR